MKEEARVRPGLAQGAAGLEGPQGDEIKEEEQVWEGVGLSLGCGSQEDQGCWYPEEGESSRQKETGKTPRGGGNTISSKGQEAGGGRSTRWQVCRARRPQPHEAARVTGDHGREQAWAGRPSGQSTCNKQSLAQYRCSANPC